MSGNSANTAHHNKKLHSRVAQNSEERDWSGFQARLDLAPLNSLILSTWILPERWHKAVSSVAGQGLGLTGFTLRMELRRRELRRSTLRAFQNRRRADFQIIKLTKWRIFIFEFYFGVPETSIFKLSSKSNVTSCAVDFTRHWHNCVTSSSVPKCN